METEKLALATASQPKEQPITVATDTSDLASPPAFIRPLVPELINLTDNITLHNSRLLDSQLALQPATTNASHNSTNLGLDHLKKSTYYKRPDVSKSKILFDGKSCVREFITSVDEYMVSRDIDEYFIVTSFSDFLTGVAKKWFRTVRVNYSSWYSLKVDLLKRFDKLDFDYQLEFLLRTRKQKSTETLSDFIIELQDMSFRLSDPLSEQNLINIIKHNMLRSYAMYFVGRNITSIDQIVRLGREIEELASDGNSIKSDKNLTCLKCKRQGHNYRNCSSIPGIICFNCHRHGVTTLTCDCNKSQNCNKKVEISEPVPKN
ncbi:unnamed protein product [Diatraea saccharalis]|uniref:Retrotransposon gag domain-containing protein n=1 Tax=Diatraea saccharalis TaxID=40085 RepID=A0A9N9R541_9NEOP|nr:unnamed protein product [Diatraea saccharalis]